MKRFANLNRNDADCWATDVLQLLTVYIIISIAPQFSFYLRDSNHLLDPVSTENGSLKLVFFFNVVFNFESISSPLYSIYSVQSVQLSTLVQLCSR